MQDYADAIRRQKGAAKSLSGLKKTGNLLSTFGPNLKLKATDALKSLTTLEAGSNSVDCDSWYLRSDVKNSHGFDLMEFLVHAHGLVDAAPGADTVLAMTGKFWDDGVAQTSLADI